MTITTATSLVETLAEKALDHEELDERERLDEHREDALAIVRASPLSGWFPITWKVVDHNLPHGAQHGHDDMVVVTADEDTPSDPPLHFLVLHGNSGLVAPYRLFVNYPNPDGWLEGAGQVRTPADVGRWLRERRALSA